MKRNSLIRLCVLVMVFLSLCNFLLTRKLSGRHDCQEYEETEIQFSRSDKEEFSSFINTTTQQENHQQLKISTVGRTAEGEEHKRDDDDWFHPTLWNASDAPFEGCFFVENVCHQAQEWFYHPTSHIEHRKPIVIRFPQFLGETTTGGTPTGAYPRDMTIERTIHDVGQSASCHYSPIPNHMILQGHFSGMLGEFYNRIFIHFAHFFHYITTTSEGIPDPKMEKLFISKTQVYLSLLPTEKKKFLDAHELFLGLFTSNPVLPFTSLFDNPACRCMKRLFFCGFTSPDHKGRSKPADSLRYKQYLQEKKYLPKLQIGPNSYISVNENARNQVLRIGITSNYFIQHKIHQFRMTVIDTAVNRIEGADIRHKQRINHTEWKIIGLVQRSSRRKWINLNSALERCNTRFRNTHKTICIEVNVEKSGMESPIRHLIIHGALDGFFSIHGATMTHAILLPKGALVVEFLPYVIDGLFNGGQWTRHVHEPTPCGLPIRGTDLNHIGYPLGRSSVLHLEKSCGGKLNKDCFVKPSNSWANRDFSVDPEGILDVIDKFLLQNLKTCNDLNKAAAQDYVLYNVNCSFTGENNTQQSIYQFYRPQDWIHKKTKSYSNAT